MVTPILQTENYIIRAFESKDLEIFTWYRAQEAVAKYQSWTNYTYQDAVELFENMDYSTFGAVGSWFQLAIAIHKSDEIIGDIAVHFIDAKQLEIGFTVSPKYQKQHVATEAVSHFLNYVFGELNMHRVIATTDTRNTASYRLLEKLTFRRESHFIQNIYFKGAWGTSINMHC